MSDSQERSIGQVINTWVQTIGIIGAAAWGAYAFVYEKVTLPKAAPINTSLTLAVKKIDVRAAGKLTVMPVEIRATATNPSPRTIYLLPTLWTASGQTLAADKADEDAMWRRIMENANNKTGQMSYMYASLKSATVLAGGNLFSDDSLRPGETISRTIIVYVPLDKFDLIDVQTHIPTVTKPDGVGLKWQLAENKKAMSPVLYWQRGDKQLPIGRGPTGEFDAPGYEFQVAFAAAQLSLWE